MDYGGWKLIQSVNSISARARRLLRSRLSRRRSASASESDDSSSFEHPFAEIYSRAAHEPRRKPIRSSDSLTQLLDKGLLETSIHQRRRSKSLESIPIAQTLRKPTTIPTLQISTVDMAVPRPRPRHLDLINIPVIQSPQDETNFGSVRSPDSYMDGGFEDSSSV